MYQKLALFDRKRLVFLGQKVVGLKFDLGVDQSGGKSQLPEVGLQRVTEFLQSFKALF